MVYDAASMVKHIQRNRGSLLLPAPRVMSSKNRIFGTIQLQNESGNVIKRQSCQAVWMLPIVLCVVYYATTWPFRLGSLPAISTESQDRPSFPDVPCGSTLQRTSPRYFYFHQNTKNQILLLKCCSRFCKVWKTLNRVCFIMLCFVTIFFLL